MHFLHFLLLFLLQTLFLKSVFSEELLTKKSKTSEALGSFSGYSSSCGDILKASTGRISYRNFDSVEPNERCVWILRYPNATSYTIILRSIGIPSSVIVSGLGYRTSVTHSVPVSPTTISLPNTNAVVITFYTGPANNSNSHNRGFSLTFNAHVNASQQSVSATSEDVVIPASNGHAKYPAGKSSYSNFELSTFIVNPVAKSNGRFKKTELTYVRLGLEGCWDTLTVYVFNINYSGTNKWVSLGEICNDVESEVITNDDLILIRFNSDSSVLGSGFHLLSRVSSQ